MRRLLRRAPAFYLLGVFVLAAVAPHHHLDSIADLLSDRPSNSGMFVRTAGAIGLEHGVYQGDFVQDESCFACFHSDFVASPAVPVFSIHPFAQALHPDFSTAPSVRSVSFSDSASRAPPRRA